MKKQKTNHYLKTEDGATAVEFSLLMVPFFLLIMGIIEISLYYASGIILEGAAMGASRVIRTGAAQLSADPKAAFEEAMCDEVGVMMDCGDITYETINFGSSFTGSTDHTPQYDEDGNLIPAGFDAGSAEDVILIRLAYRHDFFFPLTGALIEENEGSNSATHVSTVVLRTEPYDY